MFVRCISKRWCFEKSKGDCVQTMYSVGVQTHCLIVVQAHCCTIIVVPAYCLNIPWACAHEILYSASLDLIPVLLAMHLTWAIYTVHTCMHAASPWRGDMGNTQILFTRMLSNF